MKRNIYNKYLRHITCLVAIAFLFVFPALSQVKIGDTSVDPNPFSLLEIASSAGGVRLPQLTATQAAELKNYLNNQASTEEKGRAQGLLIYNTDAQKIEMWNNNNNNGKWKRLEDAADCVNAESIAIDAPVTVFTEYDTSNDLVLTANITGASPNADPLYTWYRNDEPVAVGQVLTVKKEDLSTQWSGTYTVDVLTCGFSAVGNLASAPVTITVNKVEPIKYVSVSLLYAEGSYNNVTQVNGYRVTASKTPEYILRRTPKRSISQVTMRWESPNIYDLTTQHTTAGSSSDYFSVIYFDEEGHYFTIPPIAMPANHFINGITFLPFTLNGDAYILYVPEIEPTPERYVDVCRNLFFDSPRASLLTKAFLEKYAGSLSQNTNIIPAGDYWVLDKTFTPLKGTVSYPSGKFNLVTTEAASGNFTVRCIRPTTN